ncbi:MAG: Extracellular nuclease [Parcubacteria group bacterium Gr01-1014_72]|nr:MAG: Extracellular nuclease [Parcubacteria group bacterium Gr01-1014_72]
MTLHDSIEWCKSREALTVATIILVGFGSFGLGRLSKITEGQGELRILGEGENGEVSPKSLNPPESEQGLTAAAASAAGGLLVGSKTGRKYHYPWCAGAQQISEKNKVWFASIDEARASGYAPAANCKGLE